MTRYYYTDARKASLMLSEHDVHMYMGNYEIDDYDAYTPFMATMMIEDFLYRKDNLDKFKSWDGKIYISPSCHEMLKPQENDLVEFDGIIFGLVLGNDNIETCVQCDDVVYTTNTDGCTIIQRNNKAWFTPEVEGD